MYNFVQVAYLMHMNHTLYKSYYYMIYFLYYMIDLFLTYICIYKCALEKKRNQDSILSLSKSKTKFINLLLVGSVYSYTGWWWS